MKIVCPQCRTAYDVTPAALGSDGRQVRCARCKAIWFAESPKLPGNIVPPSPQETHAASLAGAVQAEPAPPPAMDPVPAEAPWATDAPEPFPEMPAAAVAPSASPVAAFPAISNDDPAAPATGTHDAVAAAADAGGAVPEAPAAEPASPVDIESVAARRSVTTRRPAKRPARSKWRIRKLVAAAVVLAIINAGLIIGRADVVRVLPQTASLFDAVGLSVNLRDLAFKDIKTAQEIHDGVQILVVEGTIVTLGSTVANVPRLRFAIGAANGHEIYAWTALPTRTRLAPGETLPFRTRLASPPEQGRTVKIRFFSRLDLATGLR